jgi:hypothetical protein
MNLLGRSYLSKSPSQFAAYNRLQAALMKRFLKHGGTIERWIECFAPVFRRRYGWLCERPEPVLVRTSQEWPVDPNDRRYYH